MEAIGAVVANLFAGSWHRRPGLAQRTPRNREGMCHSGERSDRAL